MHLSKLMAALATLRKRDLIVWDAEIQQWRTKEKN